MTTVTPDPYIFTSDWLPSDERFLPPLANGLLGWRVFNNVMHMGGVYNGQGGQCHRADIPCPLAVQLVLGDAGVHTYSLDTRTGVFSQIVQTVNMSVSLSFYAHRSSSHILVMEVLVVRQGAAEESLTVGLKSSFKPCSEDIAFEAAEDYRGGRHIQGKTIIPEVPGGPLCSIHLIWTPLPSSVTLLPGQRQFRWVFVAVVADSEEHAKGFFDDALELMTSGDLFPSHCRVWAELWAGCGLEVSGSLPLSRALIGCLFYLLGAFPPLRKTSFRFGGDTWMYPGIALFYPQLAKAVLEYRVQTVEGARDNAKQQGYKGLKFPWESAVTGKEMCPEDIIGQQEIHINGDVGMAFQNYLYLTQDLSVFKEGRGSKVVWGIADYWVSRVTWSEEEQCYHIRGVIPPDEYYSNVDNSVYTNAVAKCSLQFAVELAERLSHTAPPEWQRIADNLKIPFDSDANYHPEFDGYKKGQPVKQADVVLLGYPLGLPMTPQVRKNDLEVYAAVTDPKGPAMTWGMFALGWLELGEADKAEDQLSKCFNNIQGPFQVWSEETDGSGTVNFLTGMGGFLQAVLFGYTGFRVQRNSLDFAPLLPKDITELRVRGVTYLGNKMDWLVRAQDVCVTLREDVASSTDAEPLEIVMKGSGARIPLKPGQSVTIPREPGRIRKLESAFSCWPL
ncbi:protein-glucosylgalactosylhydroxylysine glucosidase isoform X2 [Scleropages formosus]|uniref:protein-glucosylgalactosylhydroxylysine glucosidase isoform X2 n=1 Tax=Scleropages formosus TaxID=113540 RepID=UPI0008782CCF|nr:protein-glucosylgalactosylhydroxylysine glucosidase isoform X2 [Scleropages formosus]